MPSLFKTPVSALPGVGPKRAEQFEKLGISSVGELIQFYPRAYEDWSEVTKIADITEEGTYCVKAVVGSAVSNAVLPGGRFLCKTTVYDDTGTLKLVFFNNKYISQMLAYGAEYFFFGKITIDGYGAQMVAPAFSPSRQGPHIHPVYRSTAGLNSKTIEGAVQKSLKMLPETVGDPLPEPIRKKYDLCGLRQAMEDIHFPKTTAELEYARKRLVTEELVVLNLGMRSLRDHSRTLSGVKIRSDHSAKFEKLLPFGCGNAVFESLCTFPAKILRNERCVFHLEIVVYKLQRCVVIADHHVGELPDDVYLLRFKLIVGVECAVVVFPEKPLVVHNPAFQAHPVVHHEEPALQAHRADSRQIKQRIGHFVKAGWSAAKA